MTTPLKHSEVKFEAGSIIFKEGDLRQELYIIKSGQVAIFKMTPQNERLPLGIINSGEYLGETGLLENKPRHGTWAVALTDVEAICISAEAINEQLKSAPPWLVALCKGLAQKLRGMNDLVRRNKLADDSLDKTMIAIGDNEQKKKSVS